MIIPVVLCICLAAVFLWQEFKKKYVAAVILKGLASACFVILGFRLSNGSHMADLITTGLLLGCIADVLLNLRMVYPIKGQLIFLVGILVFLSGHIFYLAAVFAEAKHPLLYIMIAVILTTLLMIWIFKQITAKKAFKIFGVVYIGAIMLLNCVAFGNLITDTSSFSKIFACGSFLFLVSDIVLILNTFGRETKQSLRVTNIGLYYIGQLLIALSLLYT